MNTERRENVRVRPKDPTYVALRPKFAKLGRLLDISQTGLCFQYMSESKDKGDQVATPVSLEIDIFISNNGYYLPSLPCRLIYDTEVKDRKKLPSGLEDRRCGLHFGRLVKKQTDELTLYLKDHTV